MKTPNQDIPTDLSNQIRFVSHEIRNNLSVCDMYTQIISKKLQNEGIEIPAISNAINCIKKSLQIIGTDVNDLKSLNVNTQTIIDFKTIVGQGTKMAQAFALTEDKDIKYNISIKNTANIKADECRLLSCIVNIIKNATEAIDSKGEISVSGIVKDNNCILEIKNNGIPIPQQVQKHIFDCGFTTKFSGSGFGLNICKKYLESQNATLELVKSDKNETIFKITIPAINF